MATITRCDGCKKTSDEPGVSYIGREWCFKKYRDILAKLDVHKDLCADCVKKLVTENYPTNYEKDEY